MSTYTDNIQELTRRISPTLIDFSKPRDVARTPSQASSYFIANKEQGDWAEDLLFRAINDNSTRLVAVRYGKSDDIVAGDEGFEAFFQSYQSELDEIGKRPDILLFRAEDYDEALGKDISGMDHAMIESYVRKAVAGIEVRSSAYISQRYDAEMLRLTEHHKNNIFRLRDLILTQHAELLGSNPKRKAYIDILNSITEENLDAISFKVPSWSATPQVVLLRGQLKELKESLKFIQDKRDFLSITPKVEDMKVVRKWIERFGVPHYYAQVFFDKIYAISFHKILSILSDPANEDKAYKAEKDAKNQNKTTFKIDKDEGVCVASRVTEPQHNSVRKEMARGRLLFYVHFRGGEAYLDTEKFAELFGHEL